MTANTRKTILIERLQIEPHEMGVMTRLIDDAEKRRRSLEAKTAARRAAGVLPRDEYDARARHRARQARELHVFCRQ